MTELVKFVGVFLGLVAFCASGCVSDNRVRIESVSGGVADAPTLPVAVYVAEGENAATIYMTDLDSVALDPGTDLSKVSGRIVQVRMFLTPSAGNTPMGRTACSATVRHIVLAGSNIGVYSGGGFLRPSEHIGAARVGGSIEGATMRLTGSSGAFSDRLGASVLNGKFNALRDEGMARRIGARVDDVLLLIGKSAK